MWRGDFKSVASRAPKLFSKLFITLCTTTLIFFPLFSRHVLAADTDGGHPPAEFSPPAPPAAPDVAVATSADDVIRKAVQFFSSLESFSVDLHVYWLKKSPGNIHERLADYHVDIQQPNKLSIILRDGNEIMYAWVCDGRTVATYISGMKKCTRKRAPATIVDLVTGSEIETIKSSVENVLLLDLLLMNNPFEEFKNRFAPIELGAPGAALGRNGRRQQTLTLVRKSTGVPWRVSFADGAEPVPLESYADLTAAEKKPEANVKTDIRVTYANWKINPSFPASTFQFTPPAGTEMVKGFFEPEKPSPLLNKPAPGGRISLMDGSHTDVSSLKGKIVLLDFWQIHCVPCLYGMPRIEALARQYSRKGVAIFAINEIDGAEDLRKFVKDKSWGSALKMAQIGGTVSDAFGVTETPISILIDKNGVVRSVHKFMDEEAKTALSAELDALLDGREFPKPPPEKDDEP
jgi:thiol-disulfide isomerase/thioredoxin